MLNEVLVCALMMAVVSSYSRNKAQKLVSLCPIRYFLVSGSSRAILPSSFNQFFHVKLILVIETDKIHHSEVTLISRMPSTNDNITFNGRSIQTLISTPPLSRSDDTKHSISPRIRLQVLQNWLRPYSNDVTTWNSVFTYPLYTSSLCLMECLIR